MAASFWDRRDVLLAASVGAAAAIFGAGAREAHAQQVKWSEGT